MQLKLKGFQIGNRRDPSLAIIPVNDENCPVKCACFLGLLMYTYTVKEVSLLGFKSSLIKIPVPLRVGLALCNISLTLYVENFTIIASGLVVEGIQPWLRGYTVGTINVLQG